MGSSTEHHFFRFRGTVVEAERCHGGGGPGLDLYTLLGLSEGFPGRSADKESSCNAGDLGSIPGLGRSPVGWKWQPTPVFLPGQSHGQRSLVGCSHGVAESDTTATEPSTAQA